MQLTSVRETQVNIRLSPEEKACFDRVASHLGLNVPNAIRLLMRRADQDLNDASRATWLAEAPAWERDKILVDWIRERVNRFKLEVLPDDATRTFTISSQRVAPIVTLNGLTRDETIARLEKWEGGDVLRIDPHTRVVTYSPSRNGSIVEEPPPENAVDDVVRAAVKAWQEKQRAEEDAADDDVKKPKRRR
jgi:hypothetical protein